MIDITVDTSLWNGVCLLVMVNTYLVSSYFYNDLRENFLSGVDSLCMESEKIFYVVATRTTLFTVALIAYVW
jgi:hypothetical protein